MNDWNWLLPMLLGVWALVFGFWLYDTFGSGATQERWFGLGSLVVGGIGIGLVSWLARAGKKE